MAPSTIEGLRAAVAALGFRLPGFTGGADLREVLATHIRWQFEQGHQTANDEANMIRALTLIASYPWGGQLHAGDVIRLGPVKRAPDPQVMKVQKVSKDGDKILVAPADKCKVWDSGDEL